MLMVSSRSDLFCQNIVSLPGVQLCTSRQDERLSTSSQRLPDWFVSSSPRWSSSPSRHIQPLRPCFQLQLCTPRQRQVMWYTMPSPPRQSPAPQFEEIIERNLRGRECPFTGTVCVS